MNKERNMPEENTNKQEGKNKENKKGFPLSVFNAISAVLLAIVTVYLLVATLRVDDGYRMLKEISDDYINWERTASQMEVSSNTLTFEARQYAKTRLGSHIDSYFHEANENRTRENSLAAIQATFSTDTDIYRYLGEAMRESKELMNREFTSMRLVVESKGYTDITFTDLYNADGTPREEVLNAEPPVGYEDWTAVNEAMTAKEKWDLAVELVNDEVYFEAKQRIENHVSLCISGLINEVEHRQSGAMRELDGLLLQQGILIILFVVLIGVMLLIVSIQIMRPLRKAVPFIRNDSTIPVGGAREYRILARTYNRMHKINQTYREKLTYRANHDPLTGTLNRNGIEEILKTADLGNAALLMVDVDHFKRFNDQFGHAMGDMVLTNVAQTLQGQFRSEDVVCRMGGDEFAMIMWHAGPEQKDLIAEKVRKINEELGSGINGLPEVSVSVGVALGAESASGTIFRNADRAMYQTKQTARGGCTFYQPS